MGSLAIQLSVVQAGSTTTLSQGPALFGIYLFRKSRFMSVLTHLRKLHRCQSLLVAGFILQIFKDETILKKGYNNFQHNNANKFFILSSRKKTGANG